MLLVALDLHPTRKGMPFSSIDYSFCGNKQKPPNENRGYLFRVATARVRDLNLLLVEKQRQAEEWKSFMVEKSEVFRHALTGCWPGKAVRELTRSQMS